MIDDCSPYVLPAINFIAGETQDLMFNVYFYNNNRPFSLSGCSANFSIVSFRNKAGEVYVSKDMRVLYNKDQTVDSVLAVTLKPEDTVDLTGKYIYQISIRDVDGDVEIPKQGILYIFNNINKSFIKQ